MQCCCTGFAEHLDGSGCLCAVGLGHGSCRLGLLPRDPFPRRVEVDEGNAEAQRNHFARFLFGSLYEFRKTSADSQEYLVAAVDQIGAHRDCSPNKFWANLRSGKVRSATQGEWESSQPVQQTSYIKGRFDEPKTNDGVLLHERLFRKSGPQWPIPGEHARISPD